jgi:renalase
MSAAIAVIGAGLAGLTLAHRLAGHAAVSVFEKGDSVGGRLSTLWSDGFQFDHGAQYFTIRGGAFRKFLEPALAQGVVAPWDPVIVTLEVGKKEVTESRDEVIYVARPGMDGLCAHLAEGLAVTPGVDIVSLEKDGGGWRLVDVLGRE